MAFTRYQQCECSWTDSIFWGTWFIIHNKNQPSSGGKESTCNAGDPGLIPRFGKIRWRRDRSPLQYSGASLMAQMVKSLPASWTPRFDPWDGKIPWRRKWQPTPALLLGESHGRRSLVGCNPWGHQESGMTERLHFHFQGPSILLQIAECPFSWERKK